MTNLKIFSFGFLAASIFILGNTTGASAQTTASIGSFNANPQTVGYGISTNISWTLQNAGGASITVFCPDGTSATNAISGGSFPCNTKTFVSQADSDNLGLTLTNWSGTTKSVTVRLTPRDKSGVDMDSSARDIAVLVGTSPIPIGSWSAPTSTPSGVPTTFSWVSRDTPGVNLILGCSNYITATLSDGTLIQCGTLISAAMQPQSGSISLILKNSLNSSSTISVSVIPAITSTSYDQSHGETKVIEVGPFQTAPVPTITNLGITNSSPVSDSPVTLFWTGKNLEGVNVIFTCGNYVGPSLVIAGSPTSTLPCNATAFGSALSGTGSTTLSFNNLSRVADNVTITLIPKVGNGYDGTKSRTISISVQPPGSVTSAVKPSVSNYYYGLNGTTNSPSTTNSPAVSTGATTGVSNNSAAKLNLVRSLYKGLNGDDIKRLQAYFAADQKNYPGMFVSGYFGSLTETAVKKFQCLQGIACSGSPSSNGYGAVGPKTRAKLNSF